MDTVGLLCFVCKVIITEEEDINLRESGKTGGVDFEEEGKNNVNTLVICEIIKSIKYF